MTSLPTNGVLLDAGDALTTTNAKINLEKLRDCAAEMPGGAALGTLTISGGSVTPTGWVHAIDTEGAAATDDLANIVTTNHPEGRMLVLLCVSSARVVTVKHSAGGAGYVNLIDGADFVFSSGYIKLMLIRVGDHWSEIDRTYESDSAASRTYQGLGTAAIVDTGTGNGDVPILDATGYPAIDGSQITALNVQITRGEYIHIQDQKASTTNGQSLAHDSWTVRELTTEVTDEGSNAALASNQVTLAAGTYYIKAKAGSWSGDGISGYYHKHKIIWAETTSTLTDIVGMAGYVTGFAASGTTTYSYLSGKFTITAGNVTNNQDIFELKHYAYNAQHAAVPGGVSVDDGTVEIYTDIELWRVD